MDDYGGEMEAKWWWIEWIDDGDGGEMIVGDGGEMMVNWWWWCEMMAD